MPKDGENEKGSKKDSFDSSTGVVKLLVTHVLQTVLELYRQSWSHVSLPKTCYSLTRLGEFEHSAPVLTRVIVIVIEIV